MKIRLATRSAALAGILGSGLTQAATMPLPEGYGAVPRHEMAAAVWSSTSGESPSTLDRALVERVCAMKRSIGATTHTPIFESGTDRPNTVAIVQIASPRAWASYETIRGAVCDQSTTDATHDLCSCTFREMTSRYIHIRKSEGGVSEVIDVDLAKGSATRRLRKAAPLVTAAAPDAGAFGPVVGHDTIAGVPCTVHRRDLGTSRTERCLADAVESVPAPLRLQELSKTLYLAEGGGLVRRDWRRTDRIEADAEVDLGAFDIPAGSVVRTFGEPEDRP